MNEVLAPFVVGYLMAVSRWTWREAIYKDFGR